MRIGVDMLAAASKNLYDVAVLVSGDGDLVEAVKAVKDLGKHVEVATFPKGRSDELALDIGNQSSAAGSMVTVTSVTKTRLRRRLSP